MKYKIELHETSSGNWTLSLLSGGLKHIVLASESAELLPDLRKRAEQLALVLGNGEIVEELTFRQRVPYLIELYRRGVEIYEKDPSDGVVLEYFRRELSDLRRHEVKFAEAA